MQRVRLRWRQALLVALPLALALAVPSAAQANNVGDAQSLPSAGGPVPVAMPADGHQVYAVSLKGGDWLVGYSWSPGTQEATGTLRVLAPSATDVADEAVATSSPNGILFWQVPADGLYYCDYAAAPGTTISRGLFLSRPTLSLRVPRTIVVPYNGAAYLACQFTDPLYTYVPFDGPAVAFETVRLSRSHDGVSWTHTWSADTDINGMVGHRVTGLTRRTSFIFAFPGILYATAAFGDVDSQVITIIPRVALTQNAPKSAKPKVRFAVSGGLLPRCKPGPSSVVLQARKLPAGKTMQFSVSAFSTKRGPTAIRTRLSLPSRGVWAVRFLRPGDDNFAATSTGWVRVNVR